MADEPQDGGDLARMFGDEPAPATATPPAQEPVEQQVTEQPRGPNGQFASKDVTPPVEAPQPVATPAPSKPGVDPEQFKGYLDEREKRQAAEAREAEKDKRLKELEAKFQQSATPPPSIYEDPDGYANRVEDRVRLAEGRARFRMSEMLAAKEHDADTIAAAKQWGSDLSQKSEAFAKEYWENDFPIDWVIKQYKRDKTFNELGDDPDAYVRRRAAELGLIAGTTEPVLPNPAASPQSTSPPAAAAPRSILHAPSAGGGNTPTVTSGDAYDAMFGNR